MVSLANHYDMFDCAQTDWRFESDDWTLKPRRSTLSGKEAPLPPKGHVTPKGAKVDKQIPMDSNTYKQLENLWVINDKGFGVLHAKYKKDIGR